MSFYYSPEGNLFKNNLINLIFLSIFNTIYKSGKIPFFTKVILLKPKEAVVRFRTIIRFTTFLVVLCFICPNGYSEQNGDRFNEIVQNRGKKTDKALQKRPVKIAFATPLKQVSDYWRRSIDSFKGRMDEIGLKYEIEEFSTRTDEKRKLQESIQAALKTSPDYMVVTLNAPGDKAVISRLLSSNRVKVIVQNITIAEKEWRENPPFMYVGFDHTIGAGLIAEEYKKRFKKRKHVRYAMLYFIQGSKVSQLRGDHFNNLMSDSGFELCAEYYTGGNREKAKKATLKILNSQKDIQFIHACSTDIAFGALDALTSLGFAGKIEVNGWGGGASELESLMSGGLNFTVMRMNDDNGVAMAEAIRLDLENRKSEIPLIYSGKMVIVKQGLLPAELQKLKAKAFRYSDKNRGDGI